VDWSGWFASSISLAAAAAAAADSAVADSAPLQQWKLERCQSCYHWQQKLTDRLLLPVDPQVQEESFACRMTMTY